MTFADDDDFLGSFVAYFDHGLLLVEKVGSSATHDGWDASTETVHFDRDSLYVGVQTAVDGPVTVLACRAGAPADDIAMLVEVFSGDFDSGLDPVRICDSDATAVLTVRGHGSHLSVLVDEPKAASRVVVVVGDAA